MQTKYKILGTNFYDSTKEYWECYKSEVQDARTNRHILQIYDFYYKENINSDFDTLVIQELDDTFIELNESIHYAIFSKDDEDYNFVIALNTEKQYNDFFGTYSGDKSKLILAEIIKDNVRGYVNAK